MRVFRRIIIVVLIILLFFSIGLNVYQFIKNDKNTKDVQGGIEKEDEIKNQYETLYENNPIDNLFAMWTEQIDLTTLNEASITRLYCEAWEEELDNLYKELYNLAKYDEVRDKIIELQKSHKEFGNNMGALGRYEYSTAFLREGDVPENISYGSGAGISANMKKANIYREGVLELFKWFDLYSDIKPTFIFDKDKYTESLNKIYKENAMTIEDLLNPYAIEEQEYYQLMGSDNYIYYYYIFDKNKNVVKEEAHTRFPHISLIEGYLVKVWIQAGTGVSTRWTYYYDVNNDRFSETFGPVFDERNDRIAHVEWDTIYKLIVRDIFDKEKYYYEITSFNEPLAEIIDPFVDIKFSDNGRQVQVTYLTGKDYESFREVTEIIDLP